ncbi:hypothetical protein CDD82_2755 [Ophiocordyceps australis]|uniref:Cysteine synthase 2 n=1 Tax=Ophiocordyceps australis TaxID=1399860 RepID=A0A2C5ZD37_9HYPO|nr:hypothetical protein CDD82_2755 [Ophiocordyceps australis]
MASTTMSLSRHPRAYLVAAFIAGALVTLGLKDLYPDLERRFQRRHDPNNPDADTATPNNKQLRYRSSFLWGVTLEDHDADDAVVDGIQGCIGNTPLVRIESLSVATGRTILAKAEFLNGAGGSPKDRVALAMITEAERAGLLVPHRGDTVYEGSVGSTGISLAALARARGYRAHICMPDDQSAEKSDLLLSLGAVVERVPVAPITSPSHFVNLARRRAAQHAATHKDGSLGFFADQFESPANWHAHHDSTGPEIVRQTSANLDAFVAGAGTGGTISGVARHLKLDSKLAHVRVVLADPQGSGLYNRVRHGVLYANTEREGTRRRQQVDSIVEGIGINRLTQNFDAGQDLIDDAVRVSDHQACLMARWLVDHDGIFVGSSSAVNCVAAVVTAMALPPGSRVVTILCDSGSRHLSKFWKHVKHLGPENKQDAAQDAHILSLLGLATT